jgi:cysteine desulfurase
MKVYLDNAATTPLDPEVFEAMKPFLLEDFGNPSSIHTHGRKVKAAIESSRKKIAELLHCTPGEIIFTSGGTEADNTILHCSVQTFKLRHVITSPLEHHAVLHALEHLQTKGEIQLHYVNVDAKGNIDLNHLDALLKEYTPALVSLMHGNNEIGNLLDLEQTGLMCERAGAYFHSDTVQTMGHYIHDLSKLKVHGITSAAHKFHGPKGVGFMYLRKDKKILPLLHGGAQERSMRGGTENVYGIVGLAKALEIAYRNMADDRNHIESLKRHAIDLIRERIPNALFNGDSANLNNSLYTILNISLPEFSNNDMLLFNLDLQGISVSGGSACSSGAATGSHVLNALNPESTRGAVRLSFSKYNTIQEIDYTIDTLTALTTRNV